MIKNKIINRRTFLKKTAGILAFPYIIPSSAFGNTDIASPSNRVTLGFIGLGGQGGRLIPNFLGLNDVQIVALCDVKKPELEAKLKIVEKEQGKGCAVYNDFRELCARSDIDAVAIASPDHWHVLHALQAVRNGKDVYVEKPLGISLEQDKVLRDTVRKYNRVFQFGTQERSNAQTRLACQIVRNGWIGKVHTVKVGSRWSVESENYPEMSVPDWIDYDLWLGPAPWKPYTQNRVINDWWFHISDYALGFMAGCGIHTVDMAQWGNGTELTGPVEVEGTGTFPKDGLCNCATDWEVNLKFANGSVMNFTDGKKNKGGVVFEGTEGWLYVKEAHLKGTVDAYPKSVLRRRFTLDDIHLPVSNHHQRNFIDCVKSRSQPVAPIDIAVRSDTICHLNDIAMRLGRKLKWDPEKEQFINDLQANQMLTRAMRSPWHL